MKVQKYNIEIPKMDYVVISLKIKNNGQIVTLGENDLMFMTVKENVKNKDYEFQKSLGNGIAYNSETQQYDITITSTDTENFEMNKSYGYDITIYYDGNKPKQRVIGEIKIGKKFTLNEVL